MRYLILMFLMVAVLVGGVAFRADTLPPQKLVVLVREDYRYSIDFLKLRNLAEGYLRFTAEPQPGRYRAELEGRTRGIASWLTGERTQRYSAIMEQVGGGFRSVSYESSVLKYKGGQWSNRSKRYRFDYQAGKVIFDKGVGGYFKTVKEYSLPAEQTPVDILTGFFNLRAGVYGALSPGARLRIPTFTTKGVSFIAIEVLAKPAEAKKGFFPYGGTLLRIKVDSEVFETGGADDDIYLWLDIAGRPALGIVENLIGMGDVYGRLVKDLGEVHVKP